MSEPIGYEIIYIKWNISPAVMCNYSVLDQLNMFLLGSVGGFNDGRFEGLSSWKESFSLTFLQGEVPPVLSRFININPIHFG